MKTEMDQAAPDARSGTGTGPFGRCSSEVIESILAACLDSTYLLNLRQLLILQQVHPLFIDPARRLIFRHIKITKAATGLLLLNTLREHRDLGEKVRCLQIEGSAYNDEADIEVDQAGIGQGTSFSDREADGIVMLCPQLTVLDNRLGNFSNSIPLYPSRLKEFRLSYTYAEMNEDEDSEDSDHPSTSTSVPAILNRLYALPKSVDTLTMEDFHSPTLFQLNAPENRRFPLVLRKASFVHVHTLSSSLLQWMLTPAIEGACLTSLKLWGNPKFKHEDLKTLVASVGPQLEEFLFKPQTGVKDPSLALDLVPLCTNLKRLTIGPGGADHRIYDAVRSPRLTHLCINVPQAHLNLAPLADALKPAGNLSQLVRLELYSQIYFPPPVELVFAAGPPPTRAPLSNLKELRLSHVHSKPTRFQTLFEVVGPGLRALALHHVSYDTAVAVSHCSSLLRLELGVALEMGEPLGVAPPPLLEKLKTSSPNLHLLRVHLLSGVQLKSLVDALPSLKGLKTLDVTGLFPENVPRTWSGNLIGRLLNECEKKQVNFCFNGMNVSDMAGFWTAVMNFHTGAV